MRTKPDGTKYESPYTILRRELQASAWGRWRRIWTGPNRASRRAAATGARHRATALSHDQRHQAYLLRQERRAAQKAPAEDPT